MKEVMIFLAFLMILYLDSEYPELRNDCFFKIYAISVVLYVLGGVVIDLLKIVITNNETEP